MRETTKEEALNRLRSVSGHLNAVVRMVEREAYCVDIIKQILAVQGALNKVSSIILESHLQTCVTTAIRGEDPGERERVIGELMEIFEMSRRI